MDHPLYDDKDFINGHNDGDIVYKNELTSKMIEYLIMGHTSMDVGNSSPLIYKVQIIKSLSLFGSIKNVRLFYRKSRQKLQS